MSGNNIAALVLAAFLALPAASALAEDTASPPEGIAPVAPAAAPVTVSSPTPPAESVAMPKPVIRFDSEKADMGAVKAGATPEHTFTFYNDGNDTLKIISASPS
ncbi:MAG: DUF1573 domain-containing protein [Nitrospirae bacterium]|nr:DUF1573 domain-containing protein [Nitrospirota bacterium]